MFVMQHLQDIKLITAFGTSWLLWGMGRISSPQLLSLSLCNPAPMFIFLPFSKALVTGLSRS